MSRQSVVLTPSRIFYTVTIALTVTFAAACSRQEGSIKILEPQITGQLLSGSSSKADVRQLLGEPEEILFPSDKNEVWIYATTKTDVSPLVLIPFLPLLKGVSVQKESSLTIEFGQNGKVRRLGRGSLLIKDRRLLD